MEEALNSCGVILVNNNLEKPRFLILRAYAYWDFPKGGVEKGEDWKMAARREVEEETGIKKFIFLSDQYYSTEPYSKPKKSAHYFLGETTEENVIFSINPQLGKAEHDEYQWLTYEKTILKLNPRVLNALNWGNDMFKELSKKNYSKPTI